MKKQLINNLREFKDWLDKAGGELALDFETTGLDYSLMEFEGFSLCDGKSALYSNDSGCLTELAGEFNDRLFVFHNAIFDLKCCQKFVGRIPERIFCTLVGAKLINENLDSYGLKYLANKWLKVPQGQIKKYDEVCANPNSKEFLDYAMNDAIWTHQLYQGELKAFKTQDLSYIAHIEMDFQKVLLDLEVNGVRIDLDKLERFKDECSNILLRIESDMLSIFDMVHERSTGLFGQEFCESPINFGSSQQLVDLITSLDFTIDEITKKGNPSVGKNYLQKMLGQHDFFDLLWRYRKLEKLNNGFLQPLVGFLSLDGRIRPTYNMVRTGRLSCSSPNLQQLPNPKKEKLEFNHRELFIPDEGNVMVKADYAGQELRVLAEVTQDHTMINAFQNDHDLHLTTANHIFDLGLSSDSLIDGSEAHEKATKEHKAQRHQAKNGVNFPIVYGATPGRIAKDNKVSKEEAQRWLDEFFKLYPKVKETIDEIPNELWKSGFVRTLFGRKRRFPLYASCKDRGEKAAMERQAFNMKIQGSSADIGKIAGVKIRNALKLQPELKAKLILFVHDEYVVECPKKHAEKVSQIMIRCMEEATAFSVKMKVDAKVVNNFGE